MIMSQCSNDVFWEQVRCLDSRSCISTGRCFNYCDTYNSISSRIYCCNPCYWLSGRCHCLLMYHYGISHSESCLLAVPLSEPVHVRQIFCGLSFPKMLSESLTEVPSLGYLKRLIVVQICGRSGSTSSEKWPGVSTSDSASSRYGRGMSGLLLRHASICVKIESSPRM